MSPRYRIHAVVVGSLFVITMLLGMGDAYFVAPQLLSPGLQGPSPSLLLWGVFCVSFMAIGIVAIATTLFPVVRRQNEAIALTYVAFRVVEAALLLVGAVMYLFLLSGLSPGSTPEVGLLKTISAVKLSAYQLSMMILGIGSLLLNYSFFRSKVIPRWLSIWGLVGYAFLFVSAVLALVGLVDTTQGAGALLYVPGGLWELLVFPGWMLVKGFDLGSHPGATEG